MDAEGLRRLQRYIGKRPQGQTDEEILSRLEEEDRKHGLTPKEWAKLLVPLCGNAESGLFLRMQGRADLRDEAPILIDHTVRFRQRPEKESEQVVILRGLLPFVPEDDRQSVLDKALASAAWFGAYEVAKFLVEQGADTRVESNGRGLAELAQHAVDTFGDRRVLDMLMTLA
ncbi:MAG: hypothetical protein E7Z97_03735 [Propionibacteriaceae bacterium]|uniref:Ankyrin repeat-containing domain n=1 Tax=Propionibacterium ruminifibrarum TaxID=1962131 RepID=A0A375I248_9ACTN|nr:hypothetical protein [Propionibacterium ruminifibrarum]MBE6477173.1 hypothetical protein [Propionibacteriaceae bacterium]SPF68899.1 Ankyrin repeat-containing domain [Propionibacterium ruminifibrarum]